MIKSAFCDYLFLFASFLLLVVAASDESCNANGEEDSNRCFISSLFDEDHTFTFCQSDRKSAPKADPLRIVAWAKTCESGQESRWSGKWDDKTGMPKGPGQLLELKRNVNDKNDKFIASDAISRRKCLELADGLESFSGRFSSGSPSSQARVTYSYDSASLDGQTLDGAFHGRVKQTEKSKDRLRVVTVYQGGRPEGPAWIFPFDIQKDRFVVHAYFKDGKLIDFPVAVVDEKAETAFVGRLVNASVLTNVQKFVPKTLGEVNCVKAMDLSRISQVAEGGSDMKLPVAIKIDENEGRIYARPSKTIIFNRIAKTGSQSIIELLVQLEAKNGIKPSIQIRQIEHLMEPPELVANFVGSVDRASSPAAVIRHYNFVDFERYGGIWTPDYINIVRDPIDKIVSWFYYWRAAWNIVERKKAYPDEPLPDPEFLRKDFDTCVLTDDPECVFEPGSNVMLYKDHRSQIMQFCGHEPFCVEFNGERALAKAKENVEKFYPVVGVLEDMNKTLRVFEAEMPQVFAGAFDLYNSHPEIRRRQNRNAYKLPVGDEAMAKIRANFTREIEFYQFIRKRLEVQHDKI